MLTWNRRAYVEKCLASFYQKKSKDCEYEFIIIDNGSNDGTVELLNSFKTNDRRLRIIFNKQNKGVNEYKRLLKRCRGDYIVIIDDDVIEFPVNFDSIMVNCINEATDFGFLALDVVPNC
jgi:glycosyltransferase involved in cell wall biosynthesis